MRNFSFSSGASDAMLCYDQENMLPSLVDLMSQNGSSNADILQLIGSFCGWSTGGMEQIEEKRIGR